MNSIKKWLYKPKKTDKSLLAQFYFADEDLNTIASELDSFDSRKDPERCQALVAQLRACQDKVLTIIQQMMAEAIPYARSSRDFRVKFPDDVVQENLAGQLWFGAECLAAGSSIMNRELESASMRPLARALTKNLDSLRHMLREQCLVNVHDYTERIREALTIFDKLFAEFELSYVSAMVPVKSVKEYETIQEISVLFSETVIRAKSRGYVTTDMIDEYDPALMFTIPRLAIVCGLLVFADGPLNPESQSLNMSDMFRPFQTLLYKIRELLFTLSEPELLTLERALCSQEEPSFLSSCPQPGATAPSVSTSTIAIQTDSPLVKRKGKHRTTPGASASSSERLGDDTSGDISLTPEQPRKMGKARFVEQIECQSGPLSESPPSDVALELDQTAVAQSTEDPSSSRQSKNLNKSDSNDSGLHSDVVSTSDSQCTISPSDSGQHISQTACASPPLSPLVDEVVEVCMGQTEDLAADSQTCIVSEKQLDCFNLAANTQTKPVSEEQLDCFEVDYSVAVNDTYLCGGESNGTSLSRHSGHISAECVEDRLSGEEDNFYTPSSGVSPLHQSCCDTGAESETCQAVSNMMETAAHSDSALNQRPDTEGVDGDKENINSHSSALLLSGDETSGNMHNILPCHDELTVSSNVYIPPVDYDSSSDSTSEMNNSSLTDSTLTDLTPPSSNTVCNPVSTPMDFSDVSDTLSSSSPNCDTATGGCPPQAACDNESSNQKEPSESKFPSESGMANGAIALLNEMTHANDTFAAADAEENTDLFLRQCDRCTQTPHSAINNDQSCKIYHHHPHSRQHSSSQTGPAQNALPNVALRRHNTSRSSENKASLSDTVDPASLNVPASSENVKKKSVEKSHRTVGNTAPSAKKVSHAHRTGRQKSHSNRETENDARLRQYEDNWSNNENIKGKRKEKKTPVKSMTETSSLSSGCDESSSASDCESEDESCGSSETSSYNSESHDDEEIALAVQAAELANRNQARARFRSSSDMIHRLFVCISGVADQLQTNFAGDLRNILRVVFNLNCSEPVVMEDEKSFRRHRRRGARFFHQQFGDDVPHNRGLRDPPAWVPDDQSLMCMSCKTPFTFVRRRHHCRNCGKIFCGRCSSNAVSLPHFGHSKPVRVCNHCFVFQVNPFSVQAQV